MQTRRSMAAWLGLSALAGALPAWGQAPAPAKKPVGASWRFVINEAVTGETNFFLLTSRYRPLAEYLTSQLKGQHIDVEPVVDIQRFMTVAKGTPRPELIFGKSVNQLAKLVRDHGYLPLVRRADPYKAAFIVPKDSPIKTLADIGQARIIMPDEFAATTAVARAELLRNNLTHMKFMHVKFQEAVAQQVQSGLGQVGVVNPTIAKKWAAEGGRVLAETQPVVNWSFLAAPGTSPETVRYLREKLMAMNTQALPAMEAMGVKEWALAETKDYLALLQYTRE